LILGQDVKGSEREKRRKASASGNRFQWQKKCEPQGIYHVINQRCGERGKEFDQGGRGIIAIRKLLFS